MPPGGKANEVRAYSRAKTLVERRFGFVIHLAVFVPTIAIVLGLNTFFYPDQDFGVISAWAWGIAIATHAFSVFLLADTQSRTPLEATLRERRIKFYLHTFAYLSCVVFISMYFKFKATNVADMQPAGSLMDPIAAYAWLWPILFWGIAWFYHWLFTFVVRGWRVKKLKQAWTLKVMEEIDGVDRPEKFSSEEPAAEERA